MSLTRASASARTGSFRTVASTLAIPTIQKRKASAALAGLAYSTPAQFSSYYGAKLFLPELYVSRSRTLNSTVQCRKPPQMSFLGVGAPEAIMVAVVALVVFGPKGLADAAKSAGKTLRAFQPTIREVVEVSQELKGTLEKELGLNEIRDAVKPTVRPTSTSTDYPELRAADEELSKALDPEIEAKRAASLAAAWGQQAQPATSDTGSAPSGSSGSGSTISAPVAQAAAPAKDISALSMADLEAELARRKSAAGGSDGRSA